MLQEVLPAWGRGAQEGVGSPGEAEQTPSWAGALLYWCPLSGVPGRNRWVDSDHWRMKEEELSLSDSGSKFPIQSSSLDPPPEKPHIENHLG